MFDRVIRVVQPLFIVFAALFVAGFLWQNWQQLVLYPWRFNLTWFLIANALLMITWAIEIAVWNRTLWLVGGTLNFMTAVRIWFLSAITRFIPGNIWQPLNLTLYCQRRGIRPEATVTSIILFQVVILLAITPFIGLYILLSNPLPLPALSNGVISLVIGIITLPLLLVLLRPEWLFALLNWGLRKFGRPPLIATITRAEMFRLLLVTFGDWLLWGATFAAFTFSLREFSSNEIWNVLPHLVISFPIAYVIGFLSLITPSGLGVREGALALLLMPYLDPAFVAVLALGMRAWTTLGELLIAGFSIAPEQRDMNRQSVSTVPPPVAETAIDVELGSKPL